MAVPSGAVITKKIIVPAGLRDEDLEVQVETEANQYIPFALEEVNLDFQVVGPSPSGPEEVEVLIAASRKEKVEDRMAVAQAAGFQLIDIAADAGMSWNAHSWSSALNTAASLHLCAASPNVLLLELKPERSPMQNDIVSDPIEMKDGWIAVRDTPGLGVTVDDAAVRRFAFD